MTKLLESVSRVSRRGVLGLSWLVGASMLIAGLGKAVWPVEFMDSLRSWTLIPAPMQPLVSLVMPQIEIMLGMLFLLNVRRGLVAVGLAGLLLAFTVLYTLHYAYLEPPNCQCFGMWLAYRSDGQSALVLMLRNFVMTMIIASAAAMEWVPARTPLGVSARLVAYIGFLGTLGVALKISCE